MTIRKRLFGTALCLCALVCILCVSASAESGHVHPVCGAAHRDIGDHTGECRDLTWIEVTQADVDSHSGALPLESGKSYYLGGNISVKYEITIKGTVNLCLNGHTITKTLESRLMEGVVVVQPNSQFTLCDCKTGGTITHKDGVTGRGVRVGSSDAFVPQASFIMYGGSISGNKLDSQSGGGGVELHNASFRMYGGEISGNHAGNSDGGGVYAHDSSNIFLYGGTISGNTSNSNGGGISTVGCTFEMHGGEITGNTAAMDGGGAELWNASFTLSGGKISGNTASNGNGGGVYFGNSEMLTISGTMKIEGNSAVDGGGIYINKRSLMMTGGSISNNTVTGSGGGVYFGGDTFLVSGGVSIAGNKRGGTFTADGLIGGSDNNVYLPGVKVINVAGELTGSPIGVTTEAAPSSSGYVRIAMGNKNYATPEKFRYENDDTPISAVSSGSGSTNVNLVVCRHNWGTDWKTDSTGHWHACSLCGARQDYGQHAGGTATCTAKAVCEVCHTEYGDFGAHDFSDSEWEHDADHHWRKCTRCDATTPQADHEGGTATCTSPARCTLCGSLYGEPDPNNHTGTPGAWESDGSEHWKEYSCCGARAETAAHTWNAATCTAPKTCSVCGATEGNPLGHDWADATCTAPKTCKRTGCGATEGSPLGHDYTVQQHDTTQHWRKCSRCDATTPKADHEGGTATCTAKAVCEVCGSLYGEPDPNNHTGTLGAWESDGSEHWKEYSCCGVHAETAAHTWDAATCTAPKTCSVCSATEGSPLGHDFTVQQHDDDHHWKKCSRCDATDTKTAHSWDGGTVTTPATCTAEGVKTYTCNTCGATKTEPIPAAGHTAVTDDAVAATCTATGLTAGSHCSVCQTVLTAQTVTPVLGHDLTRHAAQAATCKEIGWNAYETCSRCDYTTYHELPVDPDNHDFTGAWQHDSEKHWKTCARCSAEGMKAQHSFRLSGGRFECADCGYFYYPAPAVPVSPQPGYAVCTKGESCPLAGYRDLTPNAWYHDGVHHCLETGLMRGVSAEEFRPNGSTTRAQLVTILWRLEGSPASGGQTFSDVVPGAWCEAAIGWAAGHGVVTGYSDGRFRPNDPVTREQLVAILYRYAQYKGYDVSAGADTNILSFADAFSVSEYAAPAMQWACASGLVTGAEKGGEAFLAPRDTTTRAQIAALITRFQSAYPGKA